MRRRHLLATAGFALVGASAGCTAGTDGDGDEPSDPTTAGDREGEPGNGATTDGSDDQPEHGNPDVATLPDETREPVEVPSDIESLYAIFEDDALGLVGSIPHLRYRTGNRLTVRLGIVTEPNPDGPLTIAASVTNDGAVPEYVRPGDVPPFDAPRQVPIEGYADRDPDETGSLLLRATAASPFIDEAPAAERDSIGTWRPPRNERAVEHPDRVRIDPGDTMYGEFVVLAPRGSGNIQSGSYEVRYRDAGFAITIWERDHPGPRTDSRFAGTDVPALDDSGTHWFHDAGPEQETYLHPSAERVSAPAELTFTYVNHSRETAGGNPHGWGLYKLVDDEWFHIAPAMVPLPFTWVPPGRTRSWTRRLFDGAGINTGPELSGSTTRNGDIGHLGGGRYAMRVGISADTRQPAAMFQLESEPTAVTPTADLAIVSEESSRIVFEDRSVRDGDPARRRVLSLRSTDRPLIAADRRVIPEQVMQPEHQGLRNLLANRDVTTEVRLRTTPSLTRLGLGPDEPSALIAFDGRVYRIEEVDP